MAYAVVVGAGGYIGVPMVEMLLQAGYRVKAIDRYFFGVDCFPAEVRNHPQLQLERLDIRRIGVDDLAGADTLIDLAGLSNDPSSALDPELTREINEEGGLRVLRAARQAGISRYVYSSSCSVYGHGKEISLTEDSELHPVSLYAHSKVTVEEAILDEPSNDMTATILRNATVYGYSGRMRFDLVVNFMTLNAWRESRIFIMGGGRQWRPLIHVRDVCRAIMRVLAADQSAVANRIFNVGSSDQNYQVFQIANIVRTEFPHIDLITTPDDADARTYNVSFERIRDELGFTPQYTPLDGVREIRDALSSGMIDPEDKRLITVDYYRYLIEVERKYHELAQDGKII